MSDTKADAIDNILEVRDQLVVMRERLFQLTAATAARTKKVDGLLMDCAAVGRVFRARIDLPNWDNVLAMPGHQYIPSLDAELQLEIGRICLNLNWKSPEQAFDRFNNDMISLNDILATLDEWVRSRPATLRVLERLEAAGPNGSKAAAIRAYAKGNFQRDRDGKKGKLQIVYGLLCAADGCPVAVEVFDGDTGDPKTLAAQIAKKTSF